MKKPTKLYKIWWVIGNRIVEEIKKDEPRPLGVMKALKKHLQPLYRSGQLIVVPAEKTVQDFYAKLKQIPLFEAEKVDESTLF